MVTKRTEATPRPKRPRRKTASHVRKGKIVEAVVALLHDRPGVKVEKNVFLPARSGDPKRRREIDVLITGEVAGYPARIALSCKNEHAPIKPNLIDEFIGTLDDVGIPPEHGIFVSVNGYTRGALDRAKIKGIRTLVLRGLTKDRLTSEVAQAFQFRVYLLGEITQITLTNSIGTAEYEGQFLVFCDEAQKLCGTIFDLILDKWRKGQPTLELGEYDLELDVPKGWYQFVAGKIEPVIAASCTVKVRALVIELTGKTEHHSLVDPVKDVVERSRLGVTFNLPKKGQVLPVTSFDTEMDLEKFLRRSTAVRVVSRLRLPRILCGKIYYPVSERVARLMFQTLKDRATTEKLTFSGVEGTDLSAVWEAPWYGFDNRGAPVLATDDDGNILDIRLLMEAEEFNKVVALRSEFDKSPTPEFANLLSWAYLMQSQVLIDKARDKKSDARRSLIEQAVEKIQAAVAINPFFSESYKKLGSALRELGRLDESVAAFDRAIAINEADFEAWADKAAPLINQNRFEDAIECASMAFKHASDPKSQTYALATRAAAHHFAGQATEAASDLLKAWELDWATIIESLDAHPLYELICVAAPSPQTVLLLAETRWSKAAQESAAGRSDEAQKWSDLAGHTLESLVPDDGRPVEQTGSLSNELIDQVLTRTAVSLKKHAGSALANQAARRMQAWVASVRGEELETLIKFTGSN